MTAAEEHDAADETDGLRTLTEWQDEEKIGLPWPCPIGVNKGPPLLTPPVPTPPALWFAGRNSEEAAFGVFDAEGPRGCDKPVRETARAWRLLLENEDGLGHC